MRFKLLLAMCLASMPMCLVGCDSSNENTVGTGSKEPPPDVKERIEKEQPNENECKCQIKDNKKNGQGTHTCPNGDVYESRWKDG